MGLVGDLLCDGPLPPLLRAAEVVHVGKQTSFGLGRVAIEALG
jgi:CRISPR/Cas system endoribonuclease Cas6 (RAMP superfamily)